jgi:hypothetical protein
MTDLQRLRQEIDRLRSALAIAHEQAASEGEAAERRRVALKPFAAACESCVDDEQGSIWEHAAAMEITFDDLRRARASEANND